ncbi:starch-binding protein, partial [Paenibacillus plantiphilus]|uniref:starch-binding protein n=1 Tax=Paenibacillus plantiphilus TaxID=2905650 RepID=UPI001F2027D8
VDTAKFYSAGTVSPSKLVTWVESHDTYANDKNESTNMNEWQIKMGWSIIAARAETTSLFFNRPGGSGKFGSPLGQPGNNLWKDADIVAVNKFHNAMVGESEFLRTQGNQIMLVERGTKGVTIVNLGDNAQINSETKLPNGTYTNKATGGGTFTVSNGRITGSIGGGKIAVLYEAAAPVPVISIDKQEGGFYTDKLDVKLTYTGSDTASYTVNNGTPATFSSGTTVSFGAGAAFGATFVLKVTSSNAAGQATKTYTFTKEDPNAALNVHFYKPAGWGTPNIYYYDESVTPTKIGATWPGPAMRDDGNGWYSYQIPAWTKAQVIFNSGSNQVPGASQPGYQVTGEKWIKDNVVHATNPDGPTDQAPTAPTNVQGTAAGTTSINLTWNPSTDDKGVVKYEVYRDGVLIGETTTNSYTDNTVVANKTYSYTIKAVDTIGQKSAFSAAVAVTTGNGGTQDQLPTVPTNVQGTAVGTTTVNLTWSPSTDDKGVASYEIYRNGTLKGSSTSTSYSDTTVANDNTYSYTVRAVDTIGQKSAASAPATVKIGNGGQQPQAGSPFSWDNANVYFVMTDRFNNGNTSNDGSYGRPKTDAGGKNIGTFHGGDIKGLTKKLEEGYFTDLGTNAIWITAPWEQMHGWVGGGQGDFAHYGFHGYYALDFTAMDKNMGTIDEMREFVDLAHTKGIRVVLDVVMNHVAYPNLVDMAEYNYGDRGGLAGNWLPNLSGGQNWHSHNDIMNTQNASAWSTWWGNNWIRPNGIAGYDQCSGGDFTSCVGFLPDIKTDSTSPTTLPPILKTKFGRETTGFDNWIVPAAKQYRKDLNVAPKDYMIKWLSSWVEEFGIDGFRADTAKHVQYDRWGALKIEANNALAKWRQNNPTKPGADWNDGFWMTGEVFDKGLGRDGNYFDNGFDSLINFSFQGANFSDLEALFSRYATEFNGSAANYNMLSYISSHDKRLYSRSNLIQAGTAMLLLPGAVQTFYGDETARPVGENGSDPDMGSRSDMNWGSINTAVQSHWQKIGQFRNNHIAIGAGQHAKIADAPYTFSRTYEKGDILDKVVVAVGASGSVSVNVGSIFPDGTTVRDAYTKNEVVVSGGKATFTAGTNGVILIENVGANKKFPVLTASPAGGKFKTETTTVTLSVNNADSGKYTLDGSDPVNGIAFTNGTTITIGAGMAIDETKTLKMYAVNENGEGTGSFTFTKGDPNAKLDIYFKKPAGWGTPALYFYETAPKQTNEPTWATAPAMTDVGDGWYVYSFDTAEKATMIFKDNTGKQLPGQSLPGFARTATGWYDGTTWSDTDPRTKLEPPTNLASSAKTDKTVTLTWTASTSAGITGYDVYRNNAKVGTTAATTYTDTGLAGATAYSYKVIARDQSGASSDPSNVISVTTEPGSNTGNTVTVYYKKGYATPYIHYRPEGGTWTAVPGVKMDESEVPGYAKYTIDLGASTATRVEAAFNNGSGQWDSNGQKNYFFNKGDNTFKAGVVTSGKPDAPQPGNKVTIYYKEGWTNVNIHYRAEGGTWTAVPGVKMENDPLNPGYKKI